jgi:hypothetical protein
MTPATNAASRIVRARRPADGYHVVRQGEWVSKIAAQYGIADWRRIWSHPNNSGLVQKRKEPNVIYPGDRLFIPDLMTRQENCPTDQRHQFKVATRKKKLKIVLANWKHEPRVGIPCRLEINDEISGRRTNTDGQGKAEFEIPEWVTVAHFLVGEDGSESYEVRVGHLDPIDEVSGYQQRLSNLGYNPGEIDGIEGSKTKSAIRSFQNFENYLAGSEVLKVDGIMGPKTKEKLGQRHGY